MPKRKTNEEFLKELKNILPNIIPLEKYFNNHTKIQCKCMIHDELCYTTPHLLLKGHNCCKKCLGESKSKTRMMSNEEFLQQLKNNNIDVLPLEEYNGYGKKILFKCSCGDLWKTTPQRVLIGNHCKKCGYKKFEGEKNHFYNPNLTNEDREDKNYRFRNPKYSDFIQQCFERDNYTCQISDKKSNGDIVVHHINGYNWDINNRYNINNGITLNKEIHKEFHKIYGKGNNTKEQFVRFVATLYKQKRISKEKYNFILKRLEKIK